MQPCPKCGWQNQDNAQKCANCFQVLRGGGQSTNQSPAGQMQQPQPVQGQQPYAAPGGVAAPPGPAYPGQQRPAMQRYEYIGFWTRFAAMFVDGIVVGIVRVGLYAAMGVPLNVMDRANANSEKESQLYILLAVLYAAYFVLMNTACGATLGKMAAGIKIVKTDGSPIGFGNALGRYLLQTIFAIFTCGLAYIAVATNSVHQGWHDRLMNTMVVKSK